MRLLRSSRSGVVAALLASLLLAAAATAEEPGPAPPPLRFNPFLLPDLDALARDPAGRSSGPGESSTAAWEPVLRATLLAGADSLANLGGVVLRPGEETHGYRLLEVREWEAVFDRGGEHLVLTVASGEQEGS